MSSFTATPQWMSGQAVADWLDTFFAERGWQITATTRHEERDLCLGDRHYRRPDEHYLVEYKSGVQTFYTGNVFLETMSVDSQRKPGWVYTCQADFIFYAALLNGCILILRPARLRAQIDRLKAVFPERATKKHQNAGYDTHGILVPFEYARTNLSDRIICINGATL